MRSVVSLPKDKEQVIERSFAWAIPIQGLKWNISLRLSGVTTCSQSPQSVTSLPQASQ